jgi:DNA polymerase III epsilon subunit-like protein
MYYIIFDLEFNQDFHSLGLPEEKVSQCPFEIIQIGAVKIEEGFHTVSVFNRFIKPTIYLQVSPLITDLTGITTDQLQSERPFYEVFQDYIEFICEQTSVFCVWGMSDMKELYRNVAFHKLNRKSLPDLFINLQPYTSSHLHLPAKKLLSLSSAVESLNITTAYPFHNALNDALYTAEIFKKIMNPMIKPKIYNPLASPAAVKPRQPKKVIDFERLLQQFEKMFARELSSEEQDMIKLAYQMGRTNQFINIINRQDL